MSLISSFIFIALGLAVLYKILSLVSSYRKLKRKAFKLKNPRLLLGFATQYEGYQVLFRGFKEKLFIHQAFLFIFAFRVIVYNIIIVSLFHYPLMQATIITGMSINMLMYLIKERPFKNPINSA